MKDNHFLFPDSTIQVTPINDRKQHILSEDCWCKPRRDKEEPRVIIHNRLDTGDKVDNE